MKPHEFRELVNEIRHEAVEQMYQYPPNTSVLWDFIVHHPLLNNIHKDGLHRIFCTCKAYYNAGQLRERIVRVLIDVGVKRDWIKPEGVEIGVLK